MARAVVRGGTPELRQSSFSRVWQSLMFLPLSVAVCCDGCLLGLCFEQSFENDMSYEAEELQGADCADVYGENYCNEGVIPERPFCIGEKWNKVFQLVFAVLACSCIFILKNDLRSNSLIEVNNFTDRKVHIEVKPLSKSGWLATKSLSGYRLASYSFSKYKRQVAKMSKVSALYGAELMAISLVTRRSVVAMCCHVLLASTVKGFPSHRNYMKRNNHGKEISIPLLGSPSLGYCAMLSIGVQYAQKVCVLVDTGSYNLAVAAGPQQNQANYFNTNRVDENFESLGREVSVRYSVGQWSGELARDKIAILDANNKSTEPVEVEFALIQQSDNFFVSGALWGGILGMAYSSIGQPDSNVRGFWDVLKEENDMKNVFGLNICPVLGTTQQGGELMLGGQFGLQSDSIYYTSIVKEEYYNVLISSITVGNHSVNIDCREFNKDRTIVDSGTTDIQLADNAFKAVVSTLLQYFQEALHIDIPIDFWDGLSKLAWPSDDLQFVYTEFPTIYIGFADDKDETQEFSLAITSQLYLQKVEGTLQERQSSYCHPRCSFFLFGIKSRTEGSVIGSTALSGFTTIFDRDNHRLGFALSSCKYPDYGDELFPHIIGLHSRKAENCDWKSNTIWTLISIVCICFTTGCLVIMILLKFRTLIKKCCIRISQASCCCRKYKHLHNTEVGNNTAYDREMHSDAPHSAQPLLARVMGISPIILIKKYWKMIMYHKNAFSIPQQVTEDGECDRLISEESHEETRHCKPVEEEGNSLTEPIVIVTDSGPILKESIKPDDDTNSESWGNCKECGNTQVTENSAVLRLSPRRIVPTYQIILDGTLRSATSRSVDEDSILSAENLAICNKELQDNTSNRSNHSEMLPLNQPVSHDLVSHQSPSFAMSHGITTVAYETTDILPDIKTTANPVATLKLATTIHTDLTPKHSPSEQSHNSPPECTELSKTNSGTSSDSISSDPQTAAHPASRASDVEVAHNADDHNDKLAPSKGNILDDYPKLALAETILEDSNNNPKGCDEPDEIRSGSSDDNKNDNHSSSNATESESTQSESNEVPKEIPRNKNARVNRLTKKSRKWKKGTLTQRKNLDETFNINQQNNSK